MCVVSFLKISNSYNGTFVIYVEDNKYGSALGFQWVKSPTREELARLTHTMAKRIGRYLERALILTRGGLSTSGLLIGAEVR